MLPRATLRQVFQRALGLLLSYVINHVEQKVANMLLSVHLFMVTLYSTKWLDQQVVSEPNVKDNGSRCRAYNARKRNT